MMKIGSSKLTKLIIILIIIVLLLQIIHMILLYQLESIKISKYARLRERNYIELKKLEIDKFRIDKKIQNSHILDSSGHYHIINNLLNNELIDNQNDYQKINQLNEQTEQFNDLTILTQCSASRLHYIEDLLHHYHGPISLSIFSLSKDIPNLVDVLLLLRKCLPLFREYVKIHLIYPLNHQSFSIKLNSIDLNKLSCSTLSHRLAMLRKHKDEFRLYGEGDGIEYPVNLLRNVARKNAITNYILVIDIDLIPSKSLRKDFIQLLKQKSIKIEEDKLINLNDEQIVFVLPVYEMDINIDNIGSYLDNSIEELKKENRKEINLNSNDIENDYFKLRKHHLGINLGNIVGKNFGTATLPTNKSQLLELIKKKLVRPFYYDLCFKCQKSTNYEEWQSIDDEQIKLVYEIMYRDPYEPFYIALNNDQLPYYDERFRQYGFNRISNVCELYIAGYRFLLLNNHFLVHKGWKKEDKFHKEKDLELEKNRILFRTFKNELKSKYSNSPRRC